MEILNENHDKKQFWHDLSRDYKETVGTAEMHPKDDIKKHVKENYENHK